MDPIKEAFIRAKQDIEELRSYIYYINEQLEEIKRTLVPTDTPTYPASSPTIQPLSPTHTPTHPQTPTDNLPLYGLNTSFSDVSSGNRGVPTDRQTDRQTDQHILSIQQIRSEAPRELAISTSSPPHNEENQASKSVKWGQNLPQEPWADPFPSKIIPFQQTNSDKGTLQDSIEAETQQKQGIYNSSVDSKSTFQQTDTQTNRQNIPSQQTNQQTDTSLLQEDLLLHKLPSKSTLLQANSNTLLPSITPPSQIQQVSQMLESIDHIKGELRKQFRSLTAQEMLVYTTVYQLEEEGKLVDYPLVAGKLHLSESSIRDYALKITKKGVPLVKNKLDNKKIVLSIPSELKKIASLQALLTLREQ